MSAGSSRRLRVDAGDLETAEDIDELVRRFYGDVAQDDLLGPMFNEVAQVDWPSHLPKIASFWARALLGTPGYSGNPFGEHARIHSEHAFELDHFRRWLDLFYETLNDGWVGPNVERAKMLARNVAKAHSLQLLGEALDITPYERPNPDRSASHARDAQRSEVS